ncbi:hypothetical protein B0H14DRAFT_3774064 [Mycena olivaceomarginata]|nr:hypothetical protein B0H14DRAFT_3774064 [Mycena olivaceomarginata]
MLVSDSHFVLLLPSSLVLPAAPVIDAGSTQSPTPALTTRNVFGTQPVLYGSAKLIIAAVRKKMHTKGGSLPVLRGGTRRTWIWVCLKCARFFSGGPGADTRVHIGCEFARQYE